MKNQGLTPSQLRKLKRRLLRLGKTKAVHGPSLPRKNSKPKSSDESPTAENT